MHKTAALAVRNQFLKMIADRQSLLHELSAFSLAQQCETLADGAFQVVTPLLYPDGASVAVDYHPDVDLFASSRLTDGGRTAALLADSQVFIDGYEKREQILADICRTLRVQNANGELQVLVEPGQSLADAVLRLAQACVRAADLYYVQSLRAQSGFREIFAEFLKKERPDHIEDHTIQGQFGRLIKTDFYTRQNSGVGNLIITLSSANETSSHSVANDVFCRWYDLERYRETYRFLTVVDSSSRKFRPADLGRVGSVSRVLGYPADTETLRAVLSVQG